MYLTLLNDNRTFADFSNTSLKGIYYTCKNTINLIKHTYNTVLRENYHNYTLHKDSKNGPTLNKYNVVMFRKEGNYYYGIISNILIDQIEILSTGVSYTRPINQVVHITSSTISS